MEDGITSVLDGVMLPYIETGLPAPVLCCVGGALLTPFVIGAFSFSCILDMRFVRLAVSARESDVVLARSERGLRTTLGGAG